MAKFSHAAMRTLEKTGKVKILVVESSLLFIVPFLLHTNHNLIVKQKSPGSKLNLSSRNPCILHHSTENLDTKKNQLKSLRRSLILLQSSGSFPRVILTGDFNLPNILWKQSSITSNPQYRLSLNQNILNVVENDWSHGLSQLVTFPSRGKSILDLILTTHSGLISNLHSVGGIRDHSAVTFDLNLSIKISKKKPRTVYKLNKTDFDAERMDATELSKAS